MGRLQNLKLRQTGQYAIMLNKHIMLFSLKSLVLEELLSLRRKFSLKPPWAEVEFSNDAEGFVISIYW